MTNFASRLLIFDIETGGKSAFRSSILSLGFAKGKSAPEAIHAAPAIGSQLFRWSEKNVWEKIKNKKGLVSEEALLKKFLGTLEEHKGGIVAGWNIGYQAAPQRWAGKGPAGFDIPFLITRAKRYGLEERYKEAFSNVRILDIGREYAYRASKVATKYPGAIEKNIYEQAERYASVGAAIERAFPTTTSGAARELAQQGYQLAGWKQEQAYKLLLGDTYKAHSVTEDIRALQTLVKKGITPPQTEEFAREWGKEVLSSKLASAALYAREPYQNIVSTARSHGISDRFNELLRERAAQSGARISDIERGVPFEETFRTIFSTPQIKKEPTEAFSLNLSKSTIAAGAVGLGALGFWQMKPLSIFSGKDDEYNTIEGLRHGGVAGDNRPNVGFGSGAIRGFFTGFADRIYRTGKVISWLNKESNRAIANITREIVHGVKKGQPLEVGVAGLTVAKAGYMLMEATGGTLTPGGAALGAASFIATKWGYEAIKKRASIKAATIFVKQNPLEAKFITKRAASFGVREVSQYIKHGRTSPIGQYIEAGGGTYGKQFLLASAENKLGISLSAIENLTPKDIVKLAEVHGKDDFYNVIQGFPEGGMGAKLRKIITDFGSGWRGILEMASKAFKGLGKKSTAVAASSERKGVSWYLSREEVSLGTGMSKSDFSQFVKQKQIEDAFIKNDVSKIIEKSGTSKEKWTMSGEEMRGMSDVKFTEGLASRLTDPRQRQRYIQFAQEAKSLEGENRLNKLQSLLRQNRQKSVQQVDKSLEATKIQRRIKLQEGHKRAQVDFWESTRRQGSRHTTRTTSANTQPTKIRKV